MVAKHLRPNNVFLTKTFYCSTCLTNHIRSDTNENTKTLIFEPVTSFRNYVILDVVSRKENLHNPAIIYLFRNNLSKLALSPTTKDRKQCCQSFASLDKH